MPTPEMKLVESTNIWEIGYDAENRKLWIRFNEGGTYTYDDFPPEMWTEFQAASSKGKFF
ncbi:MAG: KTSC domain-containing protein, partial [Planctomycetes bacterium]|nr:KTSC domain-containing protein [Planctomycetota bacterium]